MNPRRRVAGPWNAGESNAGKWEASTPSSVGRDRPIFRERRRGGYHLEVMSSSNEDDARPCLPSAPVRPTDGRRKPHGGVMLMSETRTTLIVLKGAGFPDSALLEALRSTHDVVEVDDSVTAARLAAESPGAIVFGHAARLAVAGASLQRAATIMESIGEGVGVVHESGEILWMDATLAARNPETLRHFADGCATALRGFNEQVADRRGGEAPLRTRRETFRSSGGWYELFVSPMVDAGKTDRAVGVLWDVTTSRRVQERVDAIETAGAELLRFDPESVAKMSPTDRLRLFERRVTQAIHSVLGYESFEVRMLDRRNGKLDLVVAVGIAPMKIGESLFALPKGNGISGHVAASGRSYVCVDVRQDPLYRDGLDDARSSLTVPLILHERVVGVLNIESREVDRFDEEDRLLAELFGRYAAMALNIMDLLVYERCATNDQVSQTITSELRQPLEELGQILSEVRSTLIERAVPIDRLDQAVESVATVRARLSTCTSGPRTMLGVDQALASGESDPLIVDRRVLVADDEPFIRQTIRAVLAKRGAVVTVCRDGNEAIEQVNAAAKAQRPFELVISDVRMPDRNGYEVFRAVKDVTAEVPVILMTGFGYDPHHSIVRSSQEGLHCFLFKPFQVSQLIDEIHKALDTRRATSG